MLNDKIKQLRQASNITQVELANELGISKQCVSNWENYYIQPSIEMLIRIADFFKVSTDYLLGRCQKASIDVTDLTDTEIAHIRLIINDLLNR